MIHLVAVIITGAVIVSILGASMTIALSVLCARKYVHLTTYINRSMSRVTYLENQHRECVSELIRAYGHLPNVTVYRSGIPQHDEPSR